MKLETMPIVILDLKQRSVAQTKEELKKDE